MFRRFVLLAGMSLLSGIAAAQQPGMALPVQPQQPQSPPAPKLVPALGWDVAKQGGFATAVTVDAQNGVWVGTEGNGLWHYDPRKKEWNQFTAKDGLGDDCIYALAVDKLGRVWAGHLNHGVSVWNGEKWRNYGIVDGPLGARVFAIATCPTDGDVWIATEVGAARYSIAGDDWDYFTRASGLPSNQIQAIAFDAKGNIYLGTQCDGIAMADAKDKYQKWAVAPGLPGMPDTSTGTGLASSLVNDITVVIPPQNAVAMGEAERLIVATPLGISTSSDYGDHFNFIRGEDWQDNWKGLMDAAQAANQPAGGANRAVINSGPVQFGGGQVFVAGGGLVVLNGNVVAGGVAQQRMLLMEDWVTSVHQEKETGKLWVGYRQKGLEIRNFGITPSIRFDTGGADMYVRSIWTGAKTPAFIAVYDGKNGGLKMPGDSTASLDAGDLPPKELPDLPSPAKPPTADSIEPLTKRLDFFQNGLEAGDAVFIGDDWNTGGDWVGHYGTSYAMLGPKDTFESESGYSVKVDLGPHHLPNDTEPLVNTGSAATDNRSVLYDPGLGFRREQDVNDRTASKENYPLAWEGPGLMVTVEIPDGIHTLSLYFQNLDAHEGSDNKLRDYDIEILHPGETQALTLKGAPLARARAVDFRGGVYKQFAVAGPAKYVVHIKRNRSFGTKLAGLFIDEAVADPSIGKKPLPGFDNVKYAAPDLPDDLDTDDNPALSAAADLWDELVQTVDKRGAIVLEQPLGIWAYRAAVAGKAPAALLSSWRWQLCVWSQEDRDAFDKAMAEAYKAYSAEHPNANQGPGN